MRLAPATIAWICSVDSVNSFTRKYKNPKTPLQENVSLHDDPWFENIALSKNLLKFWNEEIHIHSCISIQLKISFVFHILEQTVARWLKFHKQLHEFDNF